MSVLISKTQIESLQSELRVQLNELREYIEKCLHVSSRHFDAYQQRIGRPYYALDDGWGLTSLDTGEPFFVNTRDRNLTPWIIMGGHWEPNVTRPLLAYAQPGMNVLDIGAHIGYYTVKLSTKIGAGGRLMAFEPNPAVGAVCLENIKINGLAGVARLHPFALGHSDGKATLTYSRSNMTSANLLGEQDADVSVEVDVRRLDDIVPDHMIIDLVKLDAEGYEKMILEGAQRVLARSPDCALMIELGLDRWERGASLDELLPLCGGSAKLAYAVQTDGSISAMPISAMRQFLLQCAFHENYFLIAPEARAQQFVKDLIR